MRIAPPSPTRPARPVLTIVPLAVDPATPPLTAATAAALHEGLMALEGTSWRLRAAYRAALATYQDAQAALCALPIPTTPHNVWIAALNVRNDAQLALRVAREAYYSATRAHVR